MKQLTCEMCGSTDFLKTDGMFVCQSCGTKYSVEEAKKLMVDSVQIDHSDKIENYLQMATHATTAGNNVEAENYCNKVIEIDPKNYKAWFMKGSAAGWQSTAGNPRLGETVGAFLNALKHCPEEEKSTLTEECKKEICRLARALMELHAKVFMVNPTEAGVNELNANILHMQTETGLFTAGAGVDMTEANVQMGVGLLYTVRNVFDNTVYKAYTGDDGKPVDFQFRQFVSQSDACMDAAKLALGLFGTHEVEIAKVIESGDDDAVLVYEYRALAYKTMIEINSLARDACSWEKQYSALLGYYYTKNLTLAASAISLRNASNTEWQKSMDEQTKKGEAKKAELQKEKDRIEEEKKQARIAAYWAEHADEKAKLDAELDKQKAEIKALRAAWDEQVTAFKAEIAAIPGGDKIKELNERIKYLTEEKGTLGLFKIKEKKLLQEKIDQAQSEKAGVQKQMDASKAEIDKRIADAKAATEAKIEPFQKKVNEINQELTKDR